MFQVAKSPVEYMEEGEVETQQFKLKTRILLHVKALPDPIQAILHVCPESENDKPFPRCPNAITARQEIELNFIEVHRLLEALSLGLVILPDVYQPTLICRTTVTRKVSNQVFDRCKLNDIILSFTLYMV